MSDATYKLTHHQLGPDGITLTIDGETTSISVVPAGDRLYAVTAERIFSEDEEEEMARNRAAQEALFSQLQAAQANGGHAQLPFSFDELEDDDDDE